MKKRICAMMLVVVFVLTVVTGCNSANSSNSQKDSKTDTQAKANAGGEMVKGEELTPPAGKVLRRLPVDKKAEKPLKIAAIMVQNNPFGAAVLKGQEYAKGVLADRNVTVDTIAVENFDAQSWTSTLENCIASGYDAICFFGLSDALQDVVNKAVDKKILMYVFNTEPGLDSKRQAWFGLDDEAAGVKAGEQIAELIKEGEVGIITGSFSVIGHELRRNGAKSVLEKQKNIKVVSEVENGDKSEEAYNAATNMIAANADLKAIYVTAGGPSGAAKAIEDAGKAGKIKLVCHDVLEETAPYIEAGTISVCIDQDPFNQGYEPVVAAFNTLVGEAAPEEVNYYDAIVATPENVKEQFPELFK